MLFSSYLKEVLKKMPSALVVVNAIGAVLHLNGAAEKALDISASQAKGHRFADLFLPGLKARGRGIISIPC